MTVAAAPSAQADRKALWTFLRVLLGLALLAGLAYFLWTPGVWTNKLFVWVLLTILADECAGWFGYLGLALGALVFLAPGATPEQWLVVAPLIAAALFALLLVKHSGGVLVLPFAGLIYAGAVLGADKLGHSLDTPIKLLGSEEFRRVALLPMIIGLAFSFVRQLVNLLLRGHSRRRATRPLPTTPVPVPAADPTTTAPDPATPTPTPRWKKWKWSRRTRQSRWSPPLPAQRRLPPRQSRPSPRPNANKTGSGPPRVHQAARFFCSVFSGARRPGIPAAAPTAAVARGRVAAPRSGLRGAG
ncbi:hypothetical protein [Deinococcus radiodurans]|uniref:hypothetical protein n=1 Tax=Deinococcus radiodurans TaxID=1299 RepID=UPI001FB6485A|nr:hypothetical protein [Deinococcus radiodurans]